MLRGGQPLLALAVLAAVVTAGCTSALSARNFEVTPDRIGWNVGDEAAFTLTLRSTLGEKSPEYVVDPDFAIAEVAFSRKGPGLGGYSTKNSDDVDLYLVLNGTRVDEAALDTANASVGVRLLVPEDLKDAEYTLQLRLFEVGWVKSTPFRVNVP